MTGRIQARHLLPEPGRPVERAFDANIAAIVGACPSARDQPVVLLMARAGLRGGKMLGCARLRPAATRLCLDHRGLAEAGTEILADFAPMVDARIGCLWPSADRDP